MAINKEQRDYVAHIVDLLQVIGPVESKSMFGGFGVFLEGLMFGLVADNELYLKVDANNIQDYEDLGLQPFSFNRNGKEFKMAYYQAPEESLDDGELMSVWAAKSYGVAMGAAAKKGKSKSTTKNKTSNEKTGSKKASDKKASDKKQVTKRQIIRSKCALHHHRQDKS